MPFAAPSKWVQNSPLQDVVLLTKALGDETRLRILALLQEQELCACQIVAVFELANSTISKHLAILKRAGLIQSRKQSRWIYFYLPPDPPPEIAATLAWLNQCWKDDLSLKSDHIKIQQIVKINPVELCRRQNSKDYD